MAYRSKRLCFFLSLLMTFTGAGGQQWMAVHDFDLTRRMGAICFSWNGKGYVGFGHDFNAAFPFNDLNVYDPEKDSWEEETWLAGGFRTGAFCFRYGNELFVGAGTRDSGKTALRDFYKYDLAARSWTKLDSLPMRFAFGSRAMLSGDVAYVAGGCVRDSCEERLWAYHIPDHRWEPAGRLPLKSQFGVGFVLQDGLYYGLGNGFGGRAFSRIWKMNGAKKWEKTKFFSDCKRTMSIGIAVDSMMAVVGLGFRLEDYYVQAMKLDREAWEIASYPQAPFMLRDLWLYNARKGTWRQLPSLNKGRRAAVCFVIGHTLYAGMGNNEHGFSKDMYRLDLSAYE